MGVIAQNTSPELSMEDLKLKVLAAHLDNQTGPISRWEHHQGGFPSMRLHQSLEQPGLSGKCPCPWQKLKLDDLQGPFQPKQFPNSVVYSPTAQISSSPILLVLGRSYENQQTLRRRPHLTSTHPKSSC